MSVIRTPATGRGMGAGAGGLQKTTSPAATLLSSAGTSGAVAPTTTPSPAGPPGQTLDAARTFIRRPERKRRSIDNMDIYRRQQNTYAMPSNDQLLQEVMKTFEEIPSRVKDYPQMRKDIKVFLETQSDKCLRNLFELSKRIKGLETAPRTVPPTIDNITPTPPEAPEEILKRLEKVEANLKAQLNEFEAKVAKGFQDLTDNCSDNGADIVDRFIDKFDEVGGRIEGVQESLEQANIAVQFVSQAAADLGDRVGDLAGVVSARSDRIEEAVRKAAGEHTSDSLPLTYANVVAAKPGRRPALHSMAVTFEGSQETADEVLARVKKAVDARETGLKINKVRKAKNQTVILGCDTEAELKKVKERIESRGKGLIVAPMKNKNPLVVLKDVFLDCDDDEMVKALYSQNDNIFRDLDKDETDMTIKYKKRTRNPKTVHVVVQVRPKVWQRMTEAGALYLDLQRVRVEDQSPLIQCTKCLAFGHGRKFCTESADRCSHCGGPHLREKCVEFVAGNEPQCCNCLHSKLQKTEHNAFSAECPVRKKWDYLARTTTAYE